MTENWPDWLPLRPALRSRTPYGAPQVDADARLNTNENPYRLSDQLVATIAATIAGELAELNRYPDRDARELRRILAEYVNQHLRNRSKARISVANLWPANGSNEILQSILLAFGDGVAGFSPSYSMHPILTEAVGKNFKAVPLKNDFTIDLELLRGFLAAKKPDIFFLTTPNNPTGRSISIEEIGTIAAMVREHGGLLIVDEAYGEFSDQASAVNLIESNPSIVVVRTMSKAFAFAGARLGYAIAHEKVIDALQLVRLPYHLSAITQAAAIAALKESDSLLAEVAQIKRDRDSLADLLRGLGFEVIPSDANFILFGSFTSIPAINSLDSATLWQALLEKGVLIRDVGIQGWLRVTVGTHDENQLFINALREVIDA